MEIKRRQLEYFELSAGQYPFREWLLGLKDPATRHRLEVRLRKLELGNPGKWKALKDGVIELKEDFGPGFRIYLGEDGATLVILLCGGSKGSQARDIDKARNYWHLYRERKERKGHA